MKNQTSDTAMGTGTATVNPSRLTTPRWLSPERLSLAFAIALLTLLEVLPIQAALLAYTAATATSLAAAFGPFWLIILALLLFALVRWRLGRRHPIWVTLASLAIGLTMIALFVALSPTAYGDTPGGLFSSAWLNQLQRDAFYDTARFNGLFGIVPFVVYLGWRGLTLGAAPPRIEPTLRRFSISLSFVVVACICGLAVPSALQAPLQGALLTLLALDVFAGLAAAALARRGGEREAQAAEAGPETARWLLTAFGAAALVIAVAYIIGLALNFQLFSAALHALGPVGDAINNALAWLINGFAYLLWIAFVKTLGAWLFKHMAFYVTPPKSPGTPPSTHPHTVIAPPPLGFLVAAGVIVGLVVAGVIIFIIYLGVRSLLRTLRTPAEPEVDEERETLDARGMLGRQVRDLLAALRRGRGQVERDPLTPGTARWLYRETLRAGAAAGLPRRTGETADEYSQRLAQTLRERSDAPGEVEGLAAITRAYDDARYGERAEGAPPALAATSRRLTAALTRLRG